MVIDADDAADLPARRAPWRGWARAVVGAGVVAILACTSSGCGCAEGHVGNQYAVTDAQIASLLEGTSAPTTNGCQTVCAQLRWVGLGGAGDAGSVPHYPVDGCTLVQHTLTCEFHYRAC